MPEGIDLPRKRILETAEARNDREMKEHARAELETRARDDAIDQQIRKSIQIYGP